MNLDRMKFAWARGARVLWQGYGAPMHCAPAESDSIWPDDERLLYGPLSAALRDRILYGWQANELWTDFVGAALYAAAGMGAESTHYAYDEVHLHYWLFLVEMLADEGL